MAIAHLAVDAPAVDLAVEGAPPDAQGVAPGREGRELAPGLLLPGTGRRLEPDELGLVLDVFFAMEGGERELEAEVGFAVADALLCWLASRVGAEPANALAARWMIPRARASEERQPVPLGADAGSAIDPKVARTVALMEANLEEPLTTDQIAERVGVSRRQLERLFKRYLEAVPSQYYLELRLQRARQLLRSTRQSIVQIGLACGFASGPHFSSAYRNRFGAPPREDRLRGDDVVISPSAAAERGND